MSLKRITIDHETMGGAPCVTGTRVPVATVVGLLADGLPTAGVLVHYPQLNIDDVLACLEYAAIAVD